MSDRFDDGREGLEGAEPTRDLWADAHGRALQGTVPLSPVPEAKRRHPGRWLAAAAVAALVVGVGLAVVSDDDDGVSAGPEGTTGLTTPPPTYGQGTPCPFTVTGDPVQLRTGHVSGGVFDDHSLVARQETVMHGMLGDQPMEVSIPGQVVTDLVGERVEDIELERGTARLWLSDGFAQVRWFPGTDDACSSFTVTVYGPNDDFNRHAAEDFADRLVLPTATARPATDLAGTWHLASTNLEGEPRLANGEEFIFSADDVMFPLGCNEANASYSDDEPGVLRFGPAQTTLKACLDADPTADAVARVMAGGPDQPVAWTITSGSLTLHVDGASLVLAAGEPNGSTPTTTGTTADTVAHTATSSVETGDVDPATWPIQGEWDLYSVRETDQTAYPTGLTFVFSGPELRWSDGCNDYTGTVERIDGTHLNVADGTVSGAAKPCPANQTTTDVAAVIGSTGVTARLEGAAGSVYLSLSSPEGDYELVLRRANDGSSPSGDAPLG